MDMKLCVFCKHFNLDMGQADYSDLTPGHGAKIFCKKDVWEIGNMGSYDDLSDSRSNILVAEDCEMYCKAGVTVKDSS